jgi:FKBP-type peptidyl-prolyl cis-trans isomerase
MKKKIEGTKLENWTPIEKIERLEVIDLVDGKGDIVPYDTRITAHYTGALAKDGTIFQSSHDGPDKPLTFGLNQVIKGWSQGVPGMAVGGTRRLLIPADLAYGSRSPAANIPANSDLVFDIELIAMK